MRSPVHPPRPSSWWPRAAMLLVALASTVLMVNFYRTAYRPGYGLTKLILFGSELEPQVIPRLRATRHFLDPDPSARRGYDGQFYAQVALDPALRGPELAAALDTPGYRARRIGLPAVAWVLGLGKAPWVLQAYAAANALFWLLLLGVTLRLLRPWSGQGVLCLAAVLLGTGTVASISRSLTDVPATGVWHAAGELERFPRHWHQWRNLLFFDHPFHEVVTPVALFCQGLYMAVRPGPGSAVWRVGVLYALLGACLGPAVWENTDAAARTLLPMTVACYLQLAAEGRACVFWPFFTVATLPALNAGRVLRLGE